LTGAQATRLQAFAKTLKTLRFLKSFKKSKRFLRRFAPLHAKARALQSYPELTLI